MCWGFLDWEGKVDMDGRVALDDTIVCLFGVRARRV
jgi:hypothetical protein